MSTVEYDIFMVDESNDHAKSAAKKIAERAKPGAVVFLSSDEMEAIRSPDFHQISVKVAESAET